MDLGTDEGRHVSEPAVDLAARATLSPHDPCPLAVWDLSSGMEVQGRGLRGPVSDSWVMEVLFLAPGITNDEPETYGSG